MVMSVHSNNIYCLGSLTGIMLSPPRLGGYVCQLLCLEPCLPTVPTNG